MGILAIQFLMLIALIAFTTVSVQYVQKLIKATAITKYREDVDLQNIIDFIQVKDFTYSFLQPHTPPIGSSTHFSSCSFNSLFDILGFLHES